MKKALYAGSFDPLTSGHVNIIERAASICDELVVGVIRNPQKAPYFTVEERVKLIEENVAHLGNVNNGKFDVVIRGMRGTSDFDCEIQMAQMNARLYNDCVETVFLMTDPRYSFLSSSMAKEVYSLNGNLTGLVPENILKAMEEKKDDERR